jgi:hypothetical protein
MMAKGTLRSSKTFDDFSVTFQDRLEVLGRAQGLLFRTHNGERVTFDELINTELAAQCVQVKENGSVNLDGPKGVAVSGDSARRPLARSIAREPPRPNRCVRRPLTGLTAA